jgi:HAE1 family hydrophobic/amphiphilic exporter-1
MSVPVLRQADANTVEVANRIKALLPAFRADLPGAIDITVRNDFSVAIQAAINEMQQTLVLTVILTRLRLRPPRSRAKMREVTAII